MNCMFTQNLAFYRYFIRCTQGCILYSVTTVSCHGLPDYQCLLYLFTGNEVISVLNVNRIENQF